MRYLSSVGMLKEVALNIFASTNITHALANPGQQAGVEILLVSLHRIVLLRAWDTFSRSFLVSLMPKCRSMFSMLQLSFAYDIY